MHPPTPPPPLSSFQFSTIGKQPELLKRISAPEPNQDYHNDSTSSPSPLRSPALEHDEATSSKPSLLQKLTSGNNFQISTVSNAPSGLEPGTLSSAFDPVFAALFSTNNRAPSTPAPSHPPSDMDTTSSSGTTHPGTVVRSLSLTHPASADGPVGLISDKAAATSADLLNDLELAYPATEGRLSASQEPLDSRKRSSMLSDTSTYQEISAQLNAYLESKSLQQSKALDMIASLEMDFQQVASQMSLTLDKAKQVEAAADKSLNIARGAFAAAQQTTAAARHASVGLENALNALFHLRQLCADEHAVDEHDRADLLHNMTSFRRYMESSSLFPEDSHRFSRRSHAEAPGLGSEMLHIISAESMKLIRNHDPSTKKRKRSLDQIDPDNLGDESSRPSKEARIPFFDRTVELEAEEAREAWVQEVERRSTVPPDPAQQVTNEQKVEEAATQRHEDVREGVHSEALQSQPVDGSTTVPSDKQDVEFVGCCEQNQPCQTSCSDDSLKKKELQARWEREVWEQKLEIARFQMQERDVQENEGKGQDTDRMTAITIGQSPPLRTRPPPVFVPATIATANVMEQSVQQILQPKPAVTEASRTKEAALRLAAQKQRPLLAAEQGPSLASDAAQTLVHHTTTSNHTQEVPKRGANTAGQSGSCIQGQIGKDLVAEKGLEQGKKEREIDDRAAGTGPRGRGTSTTGSSVEAKNISEPSVGNVTAQKSLVASTQHRSATSLVNQQGKKTSAPQISANATMVLTMGSQFPALQPASMPGSYQPQDIRLTSLPPIEHIAEPDQAESDSTTKRPPPSRTSQKQKQGSKKPAKLPQNAGASRVNDTQPSGAVAGPTKKNATSSTPAMLPLNLSNTDVVPKAEVASPTLSQLPVDRHTPVQQTQKPPSGTRTQAATTAPQQKKHSPNSAPASVLQFSRDGHQGLSGSETSSRPVSGTAEREGPVPTSVPQPLPGNGQMVEKSSKPPSKNILANHQTFRRTPHGGHRELSGSSISSKSPQRSKLVDHAVGSKTSLPTDGQQILHDSHRELPASHNSHPTAVNSTHRLSILTAAVSVNVPATGSSTSEKAAHVSAPPNPNGQWISVSTSNNNPLRQATNQAGTSQQPSEPGSARSNFRHFRSRSRSRSPPPPIHRKRNWNAMEGDDWSPSPETQERRIRAGPRSPVPSVSRLLPETAISPSCSYPPMYDSYRPDESPRYGDNDRTPSLLNRLSEKMQDPPYRRDHNRFASVKRPRFEASKQGRVATLSERIS